MEETRPLEQQMQEKKQKFNKSAGMQPRYFAPFIARKFLETLILKNAVWVESFLGLEHC